MTTAMRIKILVLGLVAGLITTMAAGALGYVSALGQGVDAGAPVIAAPPVVDTHGLPPAAATTPVPDPLTQPVEAASMAEKLWRSGAITSSIIVIAFFVLVVLRAKIAWLGQGYRAVIVASLIGALGFAVDAIAGGATPNASMIVIALTTGLALALKPTPAAPKAS